MFSLPMTVLRIFILFSVTFSGRAVAAAADVRDFDQERVHPIVFEALKQEEAFRSDMSTNFMRQLDALRNYAHAMEPAAIIPGTIAALEQDLRYVNAFNEVARKLVIGIVGYPIQTNKMGSFVENELQKKGIIELAIDLLTQHGKHY